MKTITITIFLLFLSYISCKMKRKLNEDENPPKIPIVIDPKTFDNLTVNVVFFMFIPPQHHWKLLLDNYFDDIDETKLFDRADNIYFSISTKASDSDSVTHFNLEEDPSDHTEAINRLSEVTSFIENRFSHFVDKIYFDLTLGNLYEYPGLLKVWESAVVLPDDEEAKKHVYLYFHSKGMMNHGEIHTDNREAYKEYFDSVIKPWQYILYYFAIDDSLDKVGLECFDGAGSLRGNFFWIRGSFVRKLRRPKRSKDRFYFEHWISHIDKEQVFPKNKHYQLNYDFVDFKETLGYQSKEYKNGNCSGIWEIYAVWYRSDTVHEQMYQNEFRHLKMIDV